MRGRESHGVDRHFLFNRVMSSVNLLATTCLSRSLSFSVKGILSLLANLENNFMKIFPLTISWSKNFLLILFLMFWFIFSKLRVQSWQSSAWSGLQRIYYRKQNMNNFKPKQLTLIRWKREAETWNKYFMGWVWEYWVWVFCFIFNNPITILFLPIILIGLFFTDDRPDI